MDHFRRTTTMLDSGWTQNAIDTGYSLALPFKGSSRTRMAPLTRPSPILYVSHKAERVSGRKVEEKGG